MTGKTWLVLLVCVVASVNADQFRRGKIRTSTAPAAGGGTDNSLFDDYLSVQPEVSVCRNWRTANDMGSGTYAACNYGNALDRIGGGFNGDIDAGTHEVGLFVTYDYAGDADPQKQDATKLKWPAWMGWNNNGLGVLETAMAATGATDCTESLDMKDTFTGGPYSLTYVPLATHYSTEADDYRIDNEIVTGCEATTPYNSTTKVMFIKRAQHGSTAAAHSVNALVQRATQSIPTQPRTTISCAEGDVCVFYWEFFLTDVWLDTDWVFPGGMKTFQLHNGSLYMEPGLDFSNASVAGHGTRACYTRYVNAYNWRIRPYLVDNTNSTWASAREGETGPSWEEASEDLQPTVGNNTEFCGGDTGIWNRALWIVDFVSADWIVMDMWVWDKDRDPVKVLNGAKVGAGNANVSMARTPFNTFWQEWNYSHENFEWGTVANIDVEFVSYIKNWVMLKDTGPRASSTFTDAWITSLFARSDIRPCGVTYAC